MKYTMFCMVTVGQVSRQSNNAVASLIAMLSNHLKKLKTAIHCLGIKPKAINK